MDVSQSRGPADSDARILDAKSASRLLRHAAEIDAIRTAGLTVAELRNAALQAGISREAFDAAVAQMSSATRPDDATPDSVPGGRPASRWRDVEAVTAGVGFGMFCGWISTWTTNDAIVSIPFAIAALLSFQLAAGWRRRADLNAFLKEHVELWVGIAAGITFLGSEYWEITERLALVALMGVAAGAIGAAIVTARFVTAPRATDATDDPSTPRQPGPRPRLPDRVRSLASWLGLRDDHEASRAAPLPLLIALATSLACTASSLTAQALRLTSTVRDSAGVQIVSHPGTTDSTSARVVEDLRIGVEMGDSVYMFNRVGQVAVDRQGRLYVADGAMKIRVYGPDGKFVRAFGRRGQGPGEFTSIDRLWFAGDTLVVTSLGARRATLFSSAGDMLVTWDLRLADGGRAELLARRPNGWLAWVRPRSREMSLTPLTLFQDTVQLAMYDPVTKVPANAVLRRQAGQRRSAQADLYPPTPIFEPQPVTAIGIDGTQFHTRAGQYTIDVFDPSGRHIRRIHRAVPVKPITPKHVEQLNDYLDAPRSPDGRPRAPRGGEQRLGLQVQEKHPLAPAFAVIGAMLVAPDNSLIVQRIDAVDPIELEWLTGFNAAERPSALIARGPTRWERFDPQGRYIGAVNLPAQFQPRSYDGQRLTGVQRNADGVEFVVRYRLVPL